MKKTQQNELFLPFKYLFSEIIPVRLACAFRHFSLACFGEDTFLPLGREGYCHRNVRLSVCL